MSKCANLMDDSLIYVSKTYPNLTLKPLVALIWLSP